MRFLAESRFKKTTKTQVLLGPGNSYYRLLGEVQQEELNYNARESESSHAMIGLDNSRPRAPSAQALIPRPSQSLWVETGVRFGSNALLS